MTPELQVISLEVVQDRVTQRNGFLVARVNVTYGDLRLVGVNIAELPGGALDCWMPTNSRAHRVAMNPRFRVVLLDATAAALRALRAPAVPPLATAPQPEASPDGDAAETARTA